jgi:hypothetical protein
MISLALRITATDGAVVVIFDSPLTPAMYAELFNILCDSSTKEEIVAVVNGLAEDWGCAMSSSAMLGRFEHN